MGGFNINGGDGPDPNMETLRSHRWIIERLGPNTGAWGREELLIAKEVGLPKFRPEKIEILGGTKVYKYVKNVKWDDIQITMYDNAKITQYLTDWRNAIYLEDSGLQVHDDYKGTQIFHEIDGSGGQITTITLFGAWPVSIDWGKLSYTDTSIKIVEFSLCYDWATVIKVGEFDKFTAPATDYAANFNPAQGNYGQNY